MNTDLTTGAFTLGNGEVLGASTTRTEFLSSQAGTSSKILVKNEPWCSFSFVDVANHISLAAYFRDEKLDSIQISVVGPEYGESWSDWSPDKEMARKRANDEWLLSVGLSPGGTYSWGSVWSDYDPKGGFSCAVVRYGAGSSQETPIK